MYDFNSIFTEVNQSYIRDNGVINNLMRELNASLYSLAEISYVIERLEYDASEYVKIYLNIWKEEYPTNITLDPYDVFIEFYKDNLNSEISSILGNSPKVNKLIESIDENIYIKANAGNRFIVAEFNAYDLAEIVASIGKESEKLLELPSFQFLLEIVDKEITPDEFRELLKEYKEE